MIRGVIFFAMQKEVEDKVEDWTRPGKNSLRLLPFGPDRVGDNPARANLPQVFYQSGDVGAMKKCPNSGHLLGN